VKYAGMIFIVFAAAYGGFSLAKDLSRRCEDLRQLLVGMEILRSELSCCGTPLPKVFALMSAGTRGHSALLFSQTAKQMDKYRWMSPQECMKKVLADQSVEIKMPQTGDILLQLCGALGGYDLEHQLRGTELAVIRLKALLRDAEQDRKGKARMYRTLGLCAGLVLAILLV